MPKSKWRKVCPLHQRFLQEIQFAGNVVVLMRVAICFEYSTKPAHVKICIRKFIKPMVKKFFSRPTSKAREKRPGDKVSDSPDLDAGFTWSPQCP